MSIIFYIVNGMVIPPAMFFAGNFYRYKGGEIKFRKLWISISLISLTTLVTSLQFIFSEIIPALNRDRKAILSGEVWRLSTPLFIQPMGIGQCVFNGLFFISFVPIAERLYGRGVLLIYFATGILGQIVNFYWETTPGGLSTSKGGGSSTALFGVAGSLMMYILVNQKTFPKGYILIPLAVLLGATILVFYEDGHAPALLFGAILGLLLRRNTRQITAFPQVK
ncbi:MAG TPA: rhomboid family intramembrane serine protease [Chryseolinea sp.]|nr:rhomboid family intramembrane serine protease [Chryseolinea sp.]